MNPYEKNERMKTPLRILNLRPLLAGVVSVACTGFTVVAAEAPAPDTSTTLRQLQDQLDQRTKRIDRLHRGMGPHLRELEAGAVELEKQQQKGNVLVMHASGTPAPRPAAGTSNAWQMLHSRNTKLDEGICGKERIHWWIGLNSAK